MTDRIERYNVSRISPVNSFYDKYMFGVVFIIGALGIIVLKNLHLNQLYVTSFPVTLMLVYAITLIKIKQRRLGEDQSGDNLYYLGFLYTLVSLSYALYTFTTNIDSSNTNISMDPIINSFGIALATTIIGLMLRILFNQMRHDIVDIESEARVELANAALELRTQLDQITLDMNHFGRTTRQSISEGLQLVYQDATKSMLETSTRFSELTKTNIERLDHSLEQFAINTKKISDTSSEMVDAIESLLERVGRIEAPVDLISEKIAPAVDVLKELSDELRKKARGDEKTLNRLNATIESSIASSNLLEQNVISLNEIAVKSQTNMLNLNESAQDASSLLFSIRQSVSEAEKLTSEQSKTYHEFKNALIGSVDVLSSLIGGWKSEVDQSIIDITSKTSEAIKAVNKNTVSLQNEELHVMKELSETTGTILQTIKSHSLELDKELEKSRNYTIQVHSGLNDIVDEISSRLKVDKN